MLRQQHSSSETNTVYCGQQCCSIKKLDAENGDRGNGSACLLAYPGRPHVQPSSVLAACLRTIQEVYSSLSNPRTEKKKEICDNKMMDLSFPVCVTQYSSKGTQAHLSAIGFRQTVAPFRALLSGPWQRLHGQKLSTSWGSWRLKSRRGLAEESYIACRTTRS